MAKSRKKVFPKPPKPLYHGKSDRGTVELLGKNSNSMAWVNRKAIYQLPDTERSNINDKQLKTLVHLRKLLGLL